MRKAKYLLEQDVCSHEFIELCEDTPKTYDGYYLNVRKYEYGEMYKLYICKKCSKIVSVDFNIKDRSPVVEFEKNNKVRKR